MGLSVLIIENSGLCKMSAEVQWMIMRNNHAFLLKRNNREFSKEANNLKNKNNFRYNSLVHKKTIGIEASADSKGVVLVTKKKKCLNKPGSSHVRVQLKGGNRTVLNKVRRTILKNGYRKDLKMAALRKASALMKSYKKDSEK